MSERRPSYEPQSDSAKYARSGGTLMAIGGFFIAVEQTAMLGVEILRSMPQAETVATIAEAVGFTALTTAIAIKAPQHLDNFLRRHTD